MYTPYQTTKVDLIAGQKYDAGDIYMTRPGDGNTYIKVKLASGFRFANMQQNLKIQPFASAPKSYVQPGAFKYKFTVPQATSTYTAKIPGIQRNSTASTRMSSATCPDHKENSDREGPST